MFPQNIFRSPRSSLDEDARPPVPPKDRFPNRSHVRSASSSSQGSTGSPPGSVRRKNSIRAPKPRRAFIHFLDLTRPGSTPANSRDVYSPPLPDSPVPSHTPPLATPDLLPESPSQTRPVYVDRKVNADSFDDLNYVVYKNGIPYHPFDKKKVPYIVPYTKTAFDMERNFMDLLLKLLPTGSPTFYVYGSCPPAKVLDLGCGKGFWAAYAAAQWGMESEITAFDLIDLGGTDELLRFFKETSSDLPKTIPANIDWFRGNFLLDKLLFEDNSFDLVRMANLDMAIPIDAWDKIFGEVQRVLKPGGRLELIGDQLFFPNSSASFHREEQPTVANKRDAIYMNDYDPHSSTFTPDPAEVEYNSMASDAGLLETQFTQMLKEVYKVDVNAHKFLPVILKDKFKLGVYEVKLYMPWSPAPGRSTSRENNSPSNVTRRPSIPGLIRKASRSASLSYGEHPFGAPLKAASLMDNDKAGRYQPPGLIDGSTSTLIPCGAQALNFWACHNMLLLLACGPYLNEFIRNTMTELRRQDFERRQAEDPFNVGPEPLPFSESVVSDMMVDYELFKYKRLNIRSVGFDDDEGRPHRNQFLYGSQTRGPRDVHVRTIRVYSAQRLEDSTQKPEDLTPKDSGQKDSTGRERSATI